MFNSPLFWIIYLIVINLIGFLSMGRDKYLAQTGRWRTSENVLLLIAAVGGSAGSLAGMVLFRHKTLKKKFCYGLPGILSFHVLVLVIIMIV